MSASGLIVVAADHDVGVAEDLVEFRSPFSRTHWIRRRGDAEIAKRNHILLAFDDEDHVTKREGFDQLRKAIEDDPDALDRPFFLIGAGALAKLFGAAGRLEAQRLKQQLT